MPYYPNQDNKKLYFRTYDSDSHLNLLFLHGGGGNHLLWIEQIKFFQKKEFKVTVFDLPGHGKVNNFKPMPDIPITSSLIKKFIESYVREENCILIGHSSAGFILLDILMDPPSNLKGLIFLECPYYRNKSILLNKTLFAYQMLKKLPSERLKATENWYSNMMGSNISLEHRKLILNALREIDLEWYYQTILDQENYIPNTRFEQFSLIKVIIIEAENSLRRSPDHSFQLFFPNSPYFVIDSSDHFCFLENSSSTNEVIYNFIIKYK